jgi:hypothetical protein
MRILSAILLLLSLLSCAEEVIKKPDDLIPSQKMARILYDIAIINAAKSTNPWILKDNNVEAMDFIFGKYGIDSAQFVLSDTYYASRPMEYEAIYKKVEARLAREKDSLEESRRKQSDSVRIDAEAKRKAEYGDGRED